MKRRDRKPIEERRRWDPFSRHRFHVLSSTYYQRSYRAYEPRGIQGN